MIIVKKKTKNKGLNLMNPADTLLLLVSFLLDAGRGFPPDDWV